MWRAFQLALGFSLLSLLFGGWPAKAQLSNPKPIDHCFRKPLKENERPGWTVSGSWTSDSQLALVDALNGRILRYDANGKMVPVEPDPLRAMLEHEVGTAYPFAIASPQHEGLWVELNADNLVRITERGKIETKLPLNGMPIGNGKVIDGVFAWDLAGEDIVGFANLREGSKEENPSWTTGFFRVPARTSAVATLVGPEMSDPSPEKFWYRLGADFLAPIGDNLFVLTVDGKFELSRIGPESKLVEFVSDFPKRIRELPVLPDFDTIDDVVVLTQAIERSTIPAGLHSWNDQLFVVWRTPGSEGTEWYLTKLSPKNGTAQGTARLPTDANHLTVVAGDRYWALVEKGPVLGFAQQKVESIIFMPVMELSRITNKMESLTLCRLLARGNGGKGTN